MGKYAFVAINYKKTAEGVYVRRVLINFSGKDEDGNYIGARFITSDPYFANASASHRYSFRDDGYSLTFSKDVFEVLHLVGKERVYHVAPPIPYIPPERRCWEIECEDDAEAERLFNNREELR